MRRASPRGRPALSEKYHDQEESACRSYPSSGASTYWIDSNAWNPLARAAMISSGSARHINGLEDRLCSAMKRLIAAWSSVTEQNTPCLSLLRERLAKKPSTALSHELEVGVKWKVQRG